MAKIYRRGKRWGIDYIDPTGNRIRKIVSPYKETANKILQKIETEIVEGKYLDIRENDNILFEEFAQKYLNTYVRLENKNVKNQISLINGVVKHFKGKYLHKIDSFMIRQFMSQRIQVVKPSSVNRDFSLLKSMFNRAIEWGVFSGTNPTVGIKKLPENNERCRWLTEQEQDVLLSHCSGVTKVIVLIALKTGMRWSEIMFLKWNQAPQSNYVDLDNNTIFVHESLTKSKKSRHIPLCDSLKACLKKFPRQKGIDYAFWNLKEERRVRSIRKSFATALEKAGIADFKFHDLRHTFASQLVRNGVDLYTVQRLLGHSNPKMTQRYAHLRQDQLQNAVVTLDNNSDKIELQFADIVYNVSRQHGTNSAHCLN